MSKKTEKSIVEYLCDDKIKSSIATVVPKHIDKSRLIRVALAEVKRNPTLAKCDPSSFMNAFFQTCSLGLELGGPLQEAHPIPFNVKGQMQCQLIIGYRGLIKLARRSGEIAKIEAHAVYENDDFEYQYGTDCFLRHRPALDDRGSIIAFYAIALLKDGESQFEVMGIEAVNKIKNDSKAAQGSHSPWNKYFEEMGRKTVIRRIFKYLPVSVELQEALSAEDDSSTLYEQVKDISPKENIDDFVIEQEAEIVKESAESNDESNALAEAF